MVRDVDQDRPGNSPHVCVFRVVGSGFDAGPELAIDISGHGGNAGEDHHAELITADGDGSFETEPIRLTDGRYRVSVAPSDGRGSEKIISIAVSCDDDPPGDDEPAGHDPVVDDDEPADDEETPVGSLGSAPVAAQAPADPPPAQETTEPEAPAEQETVTDPNAFADTATNDPAPAAAPAATAAPTTLPVTGSNAQRQGLLAAALLAAGVALVGTSRRPAEA